MKKNYLILCCIIISSITVIGQNVKFKNMTPQKRAKIFTELMQTQLNLSTDQINKVAAINLKSANEMEILKSTNIGKLDKRKRAIKIQKERETLFKFVLNNEQMDKYLKKKKEMLHQLKEQKP